MKHVIGWLLFMAIAGAVLVPLYVLDFAIFTYQALPPFRVTIGVMLIVAILGLVWKIRQHDRKYPGRHRRPRPQRRVWAR